MILLQMFRPYLLKIRSKYKVLFNYINKVLFNYINNIKIILITEGTLYVYCNI